MMNINMHVAKVLFFILPFSSGLKLNAAEGQQPGWQGVNALVPQPPPALFKMKNGRDPRADKPGEQRKAFYDNNKELFKFQGAQVEPWTSQDVLCPPDRACANKWFQTYYFEFADMSIEERTKFMLDWKASMPENKFVALLYLNSNIPILDSQGQIVHVGRIEEGTPDFPTEDCPSLMVKPEREHPYCFSVFNKKHAECLSYWDIGLQNSTLMCGRCADVGYPIPMGEDPAFQHPLIWGTTANMPNWGADSTVGERFAGAKDNKINGQLWNAIKIDKHSKVNPFPLCNAKGELNAFGEKLMFSASLGKPCNTGNFDPSSAPTKNNFRGKWAREEWNNMWFFDPSTNFFWGGPWVDEATRQQIKDNQPKAGPGMFANGWEGLLSPAQQTLFKGAEQEIA